eukprot:TRINITY_DN4164_c0_g1_i3.p1 TRINITY_DN4164_c0_g1~~TRINITY_DN4164_c0_g1_i3.p1  ORF type:complete len:327 (+),score=29.03 TRINITY_DN4164_c0_g1_i3:218-1198(+)
MLMQSYLAAVACNDERVRKVIQREMLTFRPKTGGGAAGSCFASRPVPGSLEIRETCSQRLNELYFNHVDSNSDEFQSLVLLDSPIQVPEGGSKTSRENNSKELEQNKIKRSSSGLFAVSPREVSRQNSFNKQQKQKGLAEACEAVQQKVTLRCKDGTVIVNGDKAPMFIPKLNLNVITENREIYQPLPVARRAVLLQNDDIFQRLMTSKQEQFEHSKETNNEKKRLAQQWSTTSDVPTDSVLETDTDSDIDSCYRQQSQTKAKPQRRGTFTFKSVCSILDKVCQIQPEKTNGESCFLSHTGESVMQSIAHSRSKSFNKFIENEIQV